MLRELTRSTSPRCWIMVSKYVVPLVEQRKFVADFFQLQRNRLRVLHLCHVIGFPFGVTTRGGVVARHLAGGLMGARWMQTADPALQMRVSSNFWFKCGRAGCPLRTNARRIAGPCGWRPVL